MLVRPKHERVNLIIEQCRCGTKAGRLNRLLDHKRTGRNLELNPLNGSKGR
jgi:hypothetical protein